MSKLVGVLIVLVVLNACVQHPKNDSFRPNFVEVTKQVGIESEPTWKYGGPSIADMDADGRYELILSNHHESPAQLFWSSGENSYRAHAEELMSADVHGTAPGDYDGDGDLDLLVAVGGGNGQNPQPPRLLNNRNGELIDVTKEAGFSDRGARGRSVRWLDLDGDGDLDFIQINAPVLISEEIPRNLMYENTGDGKFKYRSNEMFESIPAERVLITDFDGDGRPDMVCFSPFEPVKLLRSYGEFQVEDVGHWLPVHLREGLFTTAVATLDIDNDGDLDLYFARGKAHYQIANDSLDYYPEKGRFDLRDEGGDGEDGLIFEAPESIVLSNFFRWKRDPEFVPQVFLGKEMLPIAAPVEDVVVKPSEAVGFPEKLTQSGWYLGYLGDYKWTLRWKLVGNLAWGIRASVSGVSAVSSDWDSQGEELNDVLLINSINSIDTFEDFSSRMLPEETSSNNWGVTHGDFNNDGWQDIFIYRFGRLRERLPDMLLLNSEGKSFSVIEGHGATANVGRDSHGDMGAAFDFDLDGDVDILSGDDDAGEWHLFKNTLVDSTARSDRNNYLLVEVGYSPQGVDALGAEVRLHKHDGELWQFQRVGSAGATHSQSILNTIHFGLGGKKKVGKVSIRWRNGEVVDFEIGEDINRKIATDFGG